MQKVHLLYGHNGCELSLPDTAKILENAPIAPLGSPKETIAAALANPIGSESLSTLVKKRRAQNAAITISDITRPVPNSIFLPQIIDTLNNCGIGNNKITIIIGTGLHRPSTETEILEMVGDEVCKRVHIVSHQAEKGETLTKIAAPAGCEDVSVNKIFAEADFKIVTGLVEPHFMAGYSGGRKGVCPALVDLATVQRFHGYKTLSSPLADTGQTENNPCHEESLRIAKTVGVDFLFNVAITQNRQIAGIYCGDLETAHAAACKQVAQWSTCHIDSPFDLVITNAGGYPLDDTFYQSVKGQYIALEAVKESGKLMQISACGEAIGSKAYTALMEKWSGNWRGFLDHIAKTDHTDLDQWQFQMQCRVLDKIGVSGLNFVSDAIDIDQQKKLSVTPITGSGNAICRLQAAIDSFIANNPAATIAAIPDGPYTMVKLHTKD